MGDVLSTAAAWLAAQLKATAGEAVVYARGLESVSVTATTGRSLLKLDDGLGAVRMEWTDADFLITAADLVLNGTTVTPERDDVIRRTVAGVEFTYLVVPYGAGEPLWRYSDPNMTLIRVHTKLSRKLTA